MNNFMIQCPSCGRFVEASTGIFARKKVACLCGHEIDIKQERMASRTCSKCGSTVVFDLAKGEEVECPVCHRAIKRYEPKKPDEKPVEYVEFKCPSCHCNLSAVKGTDSYTCPLCETEIDVKQVIAKEKALSSGAGSTIQFEGPNDVFVWKHPLTDFNSGTQLIVHESQEAVFYSDGKAVGPMKAGRYTLDKALHTEVYFVNMVTQMGIKWGTDSKVRLFDPASGLHIEIGASGNLSLRVKESTKLLHSVVGTTEVLTQADVNGADIFGIPFIVGKFKALIITNVKANLARVIKGNNINILEIDEYLDILSEKLRSVINETLDGYGLEMPEFFVSSVVTPDDDPNFRRLKQQFADKTLKVREEEIRKAEAEAAHDRKMVEAQTAAQMKIVGAQGDAEAIKIKAQGEAEAYRMQAFAEAEEMKAKGYTYEQETARMVGLEAMQNGLTGSGVTSVMGEMAGLGVSIGAMSGVMDMAKDAINPMMSSIGEGVKAGGAPGAPFGSGAPSPVGASEDGWDCACGQKGITSNFCPNCGAKKPEPAAPETWTCACGQAGLTTNFCPNCGARKPEPEAPSTWDCACGQKGIASNFCPNCGAKRG